MEYIHMLLCAVILIMLTVIIISLKKSKDSDGSLKDVAELLSRNQKEIGSIQSENLKNINSNVTDRLIILEKRFETLENTNNERMSEINRTIEKRLERIEKTSSEKLEDMRIIVDKKLQSTIESKMSESFRLVNERLGQVYEGLGEMRTLASGVGDLKKVLSNVKTRGMLGEIQLESILGEILSPEQYEANIATVPGSKNFVEFAIKLPGDGGKPVYMPVDSKFPSDAYIKLRDAYDSADKNSIKLAKAELISRLKLFAKDIQTKYIEVPYTTEFGIMFLPSEGLYAEAVNFGLVETLGRDYHISIAGPGTMAAMLSSIRMGFKTLAIQKRSAEVWEILGSVKTEFDKFGDVLEKTQQRLNQANAELDKLVVTRTNAIRKRLKDVESFENEQDKINKGDE